MSYLVLARKYRPRTFAEVAGQSVVTATLRGAIAEGRVGHAYLFAGPRGTGKTTSARLFAKALNCERGPAPEPCGECEVCRSIDAGNCVDVIEIDAASNTGVDNVRDLREQAAYTPMRARFKIYIVDEVHQLSKPAFNALLKTLEEPPPHVKFLLATTEPEKIPETIRSRCQILRLSLFTEEEIAARLASILATEGVSPGAGVVEGLARAARGSMRDALSIADQLLALSGDAPTLADLERAAGASGAERVERLFDALERGARADVLEALGPGEGGEAEIVASLLRELRGALVVHLCKEGSALLADFAPDRERLAARGARLGVPRLSNWMEELIAARERMARVPAHARAVLELALFEMCDAKSSVPLSVLEQRLIALEERLGARAAAQGTSSARSPAPAAQAPGAVPGPPRPAPATLTPQPALRPPPAPRTSIAEVESKPSKQAPPRAPNASDAARTQRGAKPAWEAFLAELRLLDEALAELFAKRGTLVDHAPGRARVQLSRTRPDERERLAAPEVAALCAQAFGRAAGEATVVVLEDTSQSQPGERDPFTRQVADLFQGHIEDRP
jgi:DNA polymerase-3 subunit gamma/tau